MAYSDQSTKRRHTWRRIVQGAALGLLLSSTPGYSLSISLNDITPGGMGATALAAFDEAAGIWESILSDPIDVQVDISLAALPPNILGGTLVNTTQATFDGFKGALANDITSIFDVQGTLSVFNIPTTASTVYGGSAFAFFGMEEDGTFGLDADGSADNSVLDIPCANAKALGLAPFPGECQGPDGDILFSSSFAFDFDRSDGIDVGAIDFVGVATHEIGHLLGFVSGVDIVDITGPLGPFAGIDLDDFRVFSPLDMFRYNAFTGPGLLDLGPGGLPYLSLDNGLSGLPMSSGAFHGDGHQASHWADNLGIGLLDPTLGFGEFGMLTPADVIAMDVIGWDLTPDPIPEPSTLLLMGTGLVGLVAWRRRAG